MNDNHFLPTEDCNPSKRENPLDPSILDYLILALRNIPQSLRSRFTVKSSKAAEPPLPKDDSPWVEPSEASVPIQEASFEKDIMGQPDSGRRTLLMIKLPFGVFVNFGVDRSTAPADKPAGQAGGLSLQGEKPKRIARRPFIHFRAKRKYSILTVICSLLFSLTGLWLLFQTIPGPLKWVEWVLLFNGVLMYIFATRVGDEGKISLWDYFTKGRFEFGVKDWQKVCLSLSICLAFVAAASAGYKQLMDHPYLSVFAWLSAILLAFVGGWKIGEPQRGLGKWDILLFLGFTIAALAIRAANVANNPKVLTGDEASSGLSAVLFAQGKMNNIFTMGWFSFPSFFNFLQSLFIRLFGQTTEALRLLSALGGALTVGAVFIFGSKLFNRWAGIFAALFLLAFNHHNHFSRIGLNNIWDGLWFTAVLGLLWYGWEKEDRLSFLFSGFFLGIAQYFYVTSRGLLLLVPFILLILALVDKKRAGQRLADIVLLGLVFSAVILPLLFFFTKFPLEYNAPFQRATIFGDWMAGKVQQTGQSPLMIILHQILLSLEGMISVPLRGPWYEPTTPLLRPISAILFIVGLLALLIKWKGYRTYILLLWLGIIVLIGGLSENAPAAQRYVAIAPAIALTIGFGLSELGGSIGKIRPRYTNWIFSATLAILVVFSAEEIKFYYYDYASTEKASLGGENGLIAQRLADSLQEKNSTWQVVFFGWPRMGYYSFSTLPYLAPNVTGIDQNFPWGSPDNPPVTGDHLIFVFLPEHIDDLKAVQAAYPNGRLLEETYDERTLYWWYEVTAEQ